MADTDEGGGLPADPWLPWLDTQLHHKWAGMVCCAEGLWGGVCARGEQGAGAGGAVAMLKRRTRTTRMQRRTPYSCPCSISGHSAHTCHHHINPRTLQCCVPTTTLPFQPLLHQSHAHARFHLPPHLHMLDNPHVQPMWAPAILGHGQAALLFQSTWRHWGWSWHRLWHALPEFNLQGHSILSICWIVCGI